MGMCKKCHEIDVKIERYRWFLAKAHDDPQLRAGITGLIKEAEAEKVALHPSQ